MTMRQRTIFWIGANMYYAIIDFFFNRRGVGLFGIKCSKMAPASPNFFQASIKAVMPTLKKLTPLALNLKLLCHGSFKRSL